MEGKITNALIRKENPLSFDVDRFGIVTIDDGSDDGQAVNLVKLNFVGVDGDEKTISLGPSEFGYVGEIPVYEVHLKDRINPVYCKDMRNVWDDFTRLMTYSGKRREVYRSEVELVNYRKLVEVEYRGESYFFLMNENDVIANNMRGLVAQVRDVTNVVDYSKVINGFY